MALTHAQLFDGLTSLRGYAPAEDVLLSALRPGFLEQATCGASVAVEGKDKRTGNAALRLPASSPRRLPLG